MQTNFEVDLKRKTATKDLSQPDQPGDKKQKPFVLLGHNFFPPQLNRRRPVPVDSPQFVGYIYGGAKASVINKNKSYPGKSNETMDHLYLKPLFGGRLVDPKKTHKSNQLGRMDAPSSKSGHTGKLSIELVHR